MGHVRSFVAGASVALALASSGCGASSESQGNAPGLPTGGALAGMSGGAPANGMAGAAGVGAAYATAMPCDVETVVQKHCHTCHGATPTFGAPMSLTSLADFQRDYPVVSTAQLAGQTFKMYELARIRLNRELGTQPMPQGAPLAASELSMLNTWLTNRAPGGTACLPGAGAGGVGSGGVGGTLPAGMGGMQYTGGGGGQGGTSNEGPPAIDDQCDIPDAFDPLAPKEEGELCYDFRVHGQSGASDESKFNVITGESYNQFYYEIPWPDGYVATRFGQDFDNTKVLHHWLAFGQQFGLAPGTVEPNVLGTTLFTDAELIAGWAVGGCTQTFPPNVGVALPTTGVIMVQWHHYNNTGTPQQDSTAVQICVVPESKREHKAGITFLGTETISVPAGQMGDASGTCVNDSQGPITIIGFTPHMHEIGIHMKSVVTRTGGSDDNVFDLPFQFDYQTNYLMNPPVVMMPGDTITSTCTYQNEAASSVGFGQSTKQEMCYQFALSYPYGALNNGRLSLIGASNVCW